MIFAVVIKNIDRKIIITINISDLLSLVYTVTTLFRRIAVRRGPGTAAELFGPRLRRDLGLVGAAEPADRMALLRARAKPPI